jgi:dolichol-phosphate mannosyltransferase
LSNLVIIPTYNEKENITDMIRAVFSLPEKFDILVVDDGSPDGTADLVKAAQAEHPGLHLLQRNGKNGLGTAYIAGFKWGLERGYDYLFEMDADFSHNPADLPRLLDACRSGADVAIGSRYVPGGEVKDWDKCRIMMSTWASRYVNLVLWMGVRDTTAGFKCYRRAVLESIDLDNIQFVGYAFQIEMKYAAKQLGFKLAEVPITFKDREKGKSKMNMGIFKEAFWGVLKMRFSGVTRKPQS